MTDSAAVEDQSVFDIHDDNVDDDDDVDDVVDDVDLDEEDHLFTTKTLHN